MYQKVIIVGNLGNDPVLQYTPNGDPVANFNVATNRRWTTRDGQQGEETTWFRVSVWGKQAESVNQYLSKGRQVLIEGRLSPDLETGGPRTWAGQDGIVRASYELRAFSIQFLSGGSSNGNSQPASEAAESDAVAEDEIPF